MSVCAHIAYCLLLSSQLVCTPTTWRISMVMMLAVTLAVSFLVEVSVLHRMHLSVLPGETKESALTLSPSFSVHFRNDLWNRSHCCYCTLPLCFQILTSEWVMWGTPGLTVFPFLWWSVSDQTLPQAGERWEGFRRALLEILRKVLSKRLLKECGWAGENERSRCLDCCVYVLWVKRKGCCLDPPEFPFCSCLYRKPSLRTEPCGCGWRKLSSTTPRAITRGCNGC